VVIAKVISLVTSEIAGGGFLYLINQWTIWTLLGLTVILVITAIA